MTSKKLWPLLAIITPTLAFAHGDVTPQPINTDALPDIGEEWLTENPWRDPAGENWATAIKIGDSGFNQNCARCHGLGAVSGGLAPDLRFLPADADGDEWFVERFQHGMTQNGITKMPAFGEVLGQKAAWAIRTYIETRPDEGAIDEFQDQLSAARDSLKTIAQSVADGSDPAEFKDQSEKVKAELTTINDGLATGSGAPKAESFVATAALALDGSPESYKHAAEMLDIGLSAAQ